MSSQTDKFDPLNPGGNGGSTNGTSPKNFSSSGFNFVDGDGKVIKNVPLNANNQAIYTKTITAEDLGQKTIGAQFTGNNRFRAGGSDNFTMHVKDEKGNLLPNAALPTVNQIVAGPGIYISAPNGQGVVTISTSPIPLEPTTESLFGVKWSKVSETLLPYGAIGQFTAVGLNGTNLRSRDGVNWVQMYSGHDTPIADLSSELHSSIPDGHLEYNGVGLNGTSIYGRLDRQDDNGCCGADGMFTVEQLSDQYGLITDNFNATNVFVIGVGGGTPGGPTNPDFTIRAHGTDGSGDNNTFIYNSSRDNLPVPEMVNFYITPNKNWSTIFGTATTAVIDLYLDNTYLGGLTNGDNNANEKPIGGLEPRIPYTADKLISTLNNAQITIVQGQVYTYKVEMTKLGAPSTIITATTQIVWN